MLGADMAKALKPASASPNKIQLRSLFMFSSFFCAIPLPRSDTLGTENESGVPYITRLRGGVAKHPYENMIRRHATWMGIHPRSATFVSRFHNINFGEVYL